MKLLKRDVSRATVAFAYLVLSLLMLGGMTLYTLIEQHTDINETYRHPLVASNAVQDIRIRLQTIDQQMHVITPDSSQPELDRAIERIMAEEPEILRLFDQLQKRLADRKGEVAAARSAFLAWLPLREQMLAEVRRKAFGKRYRQASEKSFRHLAQVAEQLNALNAVAVRKAKSDRDAADQHFSYTLWVITLFALFLVFSSIAVAIAMVVSLRRSQRAMSQNLGLLEESKSRYLELLNAAPDGIVIVDEKRRIQMVNRQTEEMFGYSAEELLQQPIETLIPPQLRQRHEKWVGQYLKSPSSRNVNQGRRLDGYRRNGTVFPALVALSPVRIGKELLVTASVRDLTDDIRLEKKMLHARKMEGIGTLVGGIAHEFNNILAGFVGNLYLLQLRTQDERAKAYIRSMDHGAARAANIVKQLMAFTHQGILQMQRIDLADLAAQSLQASKLPDAIDFMLDTKMDGCEIMGDRQMLKKAMLGLIDNARDAVGASEHPTIKLTLQRVDGEMLHPDYPELSQPFYACLSVCDNGCGMTSSEIEQLFEPFFTTKEVGSGTGLGLAMIYGVITSHQGAIKVESEVGSGTCVQIYLPCLDVRRESAEEMEKPSQVAAEVGRRMILIADDEPQIRDMLISILPQFGYRVVAVRDGFEATELFVTHRKEIELALLDIMMPRMGGIAAAHRMREMAPELPIIFMTGYDQSAIIDQGVDQLDHSAIVTKPFSIESLVQVIEELQGAGAV